MDRTTIIRLCVLAVSAAVLTLSAGCSSKTEPVNGRVKFKDGADVSVLAGHTVTFETENDRVSAYGDISADGTFKVTTHTPNDGAVPGRHRVAISPPEPKPDAPPPKPVLPKKYNDFGTSGLTVEIKPGTNNVEFELDRAP